MMVSKLFLKLKFKKQWNTLNCISIV